MQRIWLKSYPKGIPAEIDWNQYRSIGELFERSVAAFGPRPAYTNFGRTLTFADLDDLSRRFGSWLQRKRLARGARVALMMPNCLQYPVCAFGILRAGYSVVNVNPLYTPPELAHQLKDSGAEVIVVLENFAHVVQQSLEGTAVRHVVVAALGDLLGAKGALVNFVVRHVKRKVPSWDLPGAIRFTRLLSEASALALQPSGTGHDDIAFLQYTGGTTGIAKGAMLLHRNILANLEQASAWLKPFLDERASQVMITALPLYHVLSLTANCLLMMKVGGLNILITDPRDIDGMVRELARHRFTLITGVNTLFNALLNHPDFAKVDTSALKVTLGGGMAVQKSVADRWKAVTGCTLVEAYGLSETSPAVTINPLDLKQFNGSIGLPVPSTDIEIRDEHGHEAPTGQPGELGVRGPQVMKGYWNQPAETARVLDENGFFATGDIATIDERGFVRIVDRKKDMIVVSGLKVYPNEIEAVIAQHPGVLECVAIGVPDPHSGEAAKVLVVKKDPGLNEAELRRFCAERLTAYKRPKYVEFREDLPKTAVGKILRRALREEPRAA